MSRSIPAVFYDPKLKLHVIVTRHEAKTLVDRGCGLINKPRPDVILGGRPGDPVLDDELAKVLDRLT